MPETNGFGETEDVAVTVLVDNRADLTQKSTGMVKRFTDRPLVAEHGFAALIHLKAAGTRVLWDAGLTAGALMENMRRMKLDPAAIDRVALSHGHRDHTGGVTEVIKAIDVLPRPRRWKRRATTEEMRSYAEGRRVPLVVHPAALRERWVVRKTGTRYGPILPPPRAEWEAAGAEIILSEGPYELGPGCWTTGAIPRLSFEKSGAPSTMAYWDGSALVRDYLEDDQAVVINVKDKGLVIVSGCAHSGIVNTVNYAREISGVQTVWAIIGGFHLGRSSDREIRRTVAEIKKLAPKMVVPSHCTGFAAIQQFAAEMPDEFVPGLVGTTYLF